MKTTILTAAVLLALGISAHAEDSFSDVKQEAKTSTSSEESDKANAEAAAKAKKDDKEKDAKAKAEAEAKAKADKEKADKEAAAKKSEASKEEGKKNKKITGFQNNDGVTGDLEVGIVGGETVLKFTPDTCKTGNCTKVVLFNNKNLDDMKALRDAFGEAAKEKAEESSEVLTASERRRADKKKEREDSAVTEKEVREEIASMLSTECGIDEDSVKRGSHDTRAGQNLDSALGKTRFAGLEMPEKSSDSNSSDQYRSDAECSASVLKTFMADHESEDMTDLKDKLSDLKEAQRILKADLRSEGNEKARARIEKKLEAIKTEIAHVQKDLDSAKKTASAYDRATLGVAKRMIINPAVSDLATRKFFTSEDFFLHDLAATTSDDFKGVRKAASNSLLDIYRKQSQSYLAFSEMASKTTDPAQKLQYQQTAMFYQQAGMNYNAMMSNSRFRGELANSASQAGLDPKSVLEDIYGNYSAGAQEITTYLSKVGVNGAVARGGTSAIPEVLLVQNADGTYSQVTVTGSTNVGARGERVGAGMNQGRVIQLARPVPTPPNGLINNNQQKINIQQPQPVINTGRVGRQ